MEIDICKDCDTCEFSHDDGSTAIWCCHPKLKNGPEEVYYVKESKSCPKEKENE